MAGFSRRELIASTAAVSTATVGLFESHGAQAQEPDNGSDPGPREWHTALQRLET